MFGKRMSLYICILLVMIFIIWLGRFQFKKILKKSSGKVEVCFIVVILALYYRHFIGQIPLITNTVHVVREGKIIEFEPSKHVRRYQSAENLYDITIKDHVSGKLIKCKAVKAPKSAKGRNVEIYLFETTDLTDVITKVNGKPTEYYKKVLPANRFEKTMVFLMIAIHTVILAVMLGEEYFQAGKKKYGTKWYFLGMAGLVGYVSFLGISMLNRFDNHILGEVIGDSFVVYFISYTFLLWEIVKNEQYEKKDEKETTPVENEAEEKETITVNEEIKSTPAKVKTGMKTIQFEQMSQTEAERYCKYKYNARRMSKDVKDDIDLIEHLYILIGMFAFVFLESVQRKLVIWGLVILLIITPFIIMKYFNKKYMPIKKASRSSCEYVFTTARIEKYIKCICVDGHRIFWFMDYDDAYEVSDGDEIAVVYLSATRQLFTEKADTIKKILEEK